MANYTQIAQETFEFSREDGTSRRWRYTFEQDGVAAQTYSVPKVNSTQIKHGDRSDDRNKPFKVSEAVFTLKGVDEPLIDVIDKSGTREVRVTIEDLESGVTEFQGFVLPEFSTKRELYNDLISLKVRCYGGLADTDEFTIGTINEALTIHEAAEKVGNIIGLDRELDLYSTLRHENQSSSIELPTKLRFIERYAVGRQADKTYREAINMMLTAFGWRMFQIDGRLVIADLYDQYVNRTGLTKFASNGDGTYTKSTTGSKVVSLDKNNSIRFPVTKRMPPVISHRQVHNIIERNLALWSDPSPINITRGNETTYAFDRGLAFGGDELGLRIEGELTTANEPNVSGTLKYARCELYDNSGNTWYYDPIAEEFKTDGVYHFEEGFTFTSDPGDPSKSWSFEFEGKIGPIPEDIDVAEIKLVAECTVDISSGDISDLVDNEYDFFVGNLTYKNNDAFAIRLTDVTSGEQKGQVSKGISFLGDNNMETNWGVLSYYNPNTTSWENTFNWISGTGNGELTEVVGERVARVVVGEGEEFQHLVRDTVAIIDLITTLEVTLDDGSTTLALPVSIEHDIDNGFYYIRSEEILDGVGSSNTYYSTEDVSDSTGSTGSTTSGGGAGGGGGSNITDHGFLDGLDDPSDHLWAAQKDLSNVDPTTGRGALDMGPSDVIPLGQVTLNNPASADNHALRGGQNLNTNTPLSGGGKLRNGLQIGLNYNSTNLKTTSGELNTTQDIDTDAEMLLKALTVKDRLSSDDFNDPSFAGQGMRIQKDEDGQWHGIFDKITARKQLRSYKSEIQKLTQRGGTDIWSDGHSIEAVQQIGDGSWSWSDDTIQPMAPDATNAEGIPYAFANQYRCYIPDDVLMSLAVDDLVEARESSGRESFTLTGRVINTGFGFDPGGLVGHWPFDGDVTDRTGNNDGTIVGDPQFVDGVSGQGIYFSEYGDEVHVPSLKNYGLYNSYAVSFHINYEESYRGTDPYGSAGGLFHGLVGTGDNPWSSGVRIDEGNIDIYYDVGAGHEPFQLTFDDITGIDTHFIIEYDGDTLFVYKDLELIGQKQIGALNSSNQHDLTFGKWGSNYRIVGMLDEFVVYPRTLTNSERKELYDNPGYPIKKRYFDMALDSGSPAPEEGMAMSRYGNLTDPARQASMIASASEANAPYFQLLDNVDSRAKYGAPESIIGHFGNVNGLNYPPFDDINDPAFPDLDGTQGDLYAILVDRGYFTNAYFDGKLSAATAAFLELNAQQLTSGTVDTDRLDTDELFALMAMIGGFRIEGNLLEQDGPGQTLLELVGGTGNDNPYIRLRAEDGDDIYLGGNFSDNSNNNVTIDDADFDFDPGRTSISSATVNANADQSTPTDSDRNPGSGYQEATYDLGSTYNGRLVRFSMDYATSVTTNSGVDQNQNSVESTASATYQCYFELLDGGGSVVASESITRGGNSSGSFTAILSIPDSGSYTMRLRWYIASSAEARSFIGPNGSTAWLSASASASWDDNGGIEIVAVGNYITPKEMKYANDAGNEVRLRRSDGSVLSNLFFIKDASTGDYAYFQVTNGQVQLKDSGGLITFWDLN